MPIITNYPITLDVHEVLSQVSIPVPQDKARRISATLTENGSALYLPDGCRAVFSATKADGTTVNNDCIIEHNTLIRYDFTEQTTAAVGKVECCFKVYGLEGEYLYGPIFTLVVYENKAGDVTFSEDEKNFLDRIFAAEESRISAELLRDDAERARGVAETSRVAAEQERVTAENARQAALVDNLTTDDPGKYLSARMGKKLNEEKVPTTRTVNKKPLSADVALTASDVGAAPAGFGLGENPKDIGSRAILDQTLANGWYNYLSNNSESALEGFTINYADVFVIGDGVNYVTQYLYPYHNVFANTVLIRWYRNGVWTEFGWVNPPMQVGVEYRTTERWQGKPVYTKYLELGDITNTANFDTDWTGLIEKATQIVRCNWIFKNKNTGFFYNGSIREVAHAYVVNQGTGRATVTRSDFNISSGTVWSASITLYYTKD